MNASISKLFVVLAVLIGVLIVFTSRWTVFDQSALQNNSLNKLALYESWKIRRGAILADDNSVLAKSTRARGGTWGRTYPSGPLFSQAVGYANVQDGELTGIEKYRNDALSGSLKTGLSSVFGSLSTPSAGNDVYTTLDPKAQEVARSEIDASGYSGSVVALVPQTGAVKVMYSNPTYDNNRNPNSCRASNGCSLLNLATQAQLPPGSTFKVVTATAALDSGKYTPNSEINAPGTLMVSGTPLHNDEPGDLGPVSLTYALTNSINTVFAQVGENVGADTLMTYMKRYGFYADPPLDYPSGQMLPSGSKRFTKHGYVLVPVTSPSVDLGRTAIGQADLLVTPLQMAMVASAVADNGTLMQPRFSTKAVNQDGQVVQTYAPQVDDQVMKPSVAKELQQMMTDVVEEGTGQAAKLEGVPVAGKTGTATVGSRNGQPLDDAWFIGFAPVDHPKIAVAVELSNVPNGYGGVYAAPIAAKVIQQLLAEGQ